MSNNKKILFIFFFACFPVRLLLAYIVKHLSNKALIYSGYLAIVISLLFIKSYLEYKPNLSIGAFGGKVWWENMRALHASIYLLYGLLSIKKYNKSWIVLLIDAFLGAIAFSYHYRNSMYKILIK